MTHRKIAPKPNDRKTPKEDLINKAFYEASNFKALYRAWDTQVSMALRQLSGIQALLREKDGDVLIHGEEAESLLGLVTEDLERWRAHFAEHAKAEAAQ